MAYRVIVPDASCEWCDGPGPVRPPPAKNHGYCTKKGDPCPDAQGGAR